MLLTSTKANPGRKGILDQTIDALLSLPEYSHFNREDVLSYLQAVAKKESGGRNITQLGVAPKYASGYFQIEDASMPYASKGLQDIAKRSGKPLPQIQARRGMDLSAEEQAALTLGHDYIQGVAYKKPMNFHDQKNTWLDNHWVGVRNKGYAAKREAYGRSWDKVMLPTLEEKMQVMGAPRMTAAADKTLLIRPPMGSSLLDSKPVIDDPNYGKYAAVKTKP